MGEGYDFGVLNGAAVRVKEEFGASTVAISMIVAITPFAIMPGALLGGALGDAWGRWTALLVTCVLLTVSPITMAIADSVEMLILTRGFVGIGIGMGIIVTSMYVAEIAPADQRGSLTSLTAVFMNVGMLLGYFINFALLGIENDWRWMFGLGAVVPFFCTIFLFSSQVDESPRWLFSQGRDADAHQVLSRYGGRTQAMKDLLAMRNAQKLAEAEDKNSIMTWGTVINAFGQQGPNRRMLLAGCAVPLGAIFCGYLAVAYYSSTLLKATAGDRMAFVATVFMGAVKLAVCLVVVAVLDKHGRRSMLLASTSITALACALIAFSFAMALQWYWHALGFSLFMAGFELGLGPLMFVYPAEVLTTAWRAKASSLAVFLSRIVGSLHLFLFPILVEAIGASKTFGLQSLCNVCITGAFWVSIYETMGIPLEQICHLFDDKA